MILYVEQIIIKIISSFFFSCLKELLGVENVGYWEFIFCFFCKTHSRKIQNEEK